MLRGSVQTHGRTFGLDRVSRGLGRCAQALFLKGVCLGPLEAPLTLAAQLDDPVEVIKALRNGGAHLDFRARDGMTALHRAARARNQVALQVRSGACRTQGGPLPDWPPSPPPAFPIQQPPEVPHIGFRLGGVACPPTLFFVEFSVCMEQRLPLSEGLRFCPGRSVLEPSSPVWEHGADFAAAPGVFGSRCRGWVPLLSSLPRGPEHLAPWHCVCRASGRQGCCPTPTLLEPGREEEAVAHSGGQPQDGASL